MNYNKEFIEAVKNENYKTIKKLSDKVDINYQDEDGRTALHYACENLHHILVENLLNKGANPNIQDKDGNTALLYLLKSTNKDLIYFKKRGAEANVLHIADILIRAGADIEARNNKGRTALLEAVNSGYKLVSRFLIRSGANINEVDNNGRGVLSIASKKLDVNILISLLKENQLDVNTQDYKGNTPLHYATMKGNTIDGINCVIVLLDYNADPNIPNSEGRTPLHYAMLYDIEKVADILRKYGASTNIKDNYNKTPIDYKDKNKENKYVKININQRETNGKTNDK